MKIISTDNQLEIKQSGVGQIIAGVIPVLIGLGLVALAVVNRPFSVATLVFGLVFLATGGLIIAFAKNKHFIIQRGGQTSAESKRILGGSQKHHDFPTSSIVGVRLYTSESQTQSNPTAQTSGNRQSVLSLLLNNNDIVEIGRKSAASGGMGSFISHAPLSKEADQIAAFLGLQVDAQDSSSILGSVKMIKNAYQAAKAPPTQPAAGPPQPVQPVATAPPATPPITPPYAAAPTAGSPPLNPLPPPPPPTIPQNPTATNNSTQLPPNNQSQ